jgi:hypothetical protein
VLYAQISPASHAVVVAIAITPNARLFISIGLSRNKQRITRPIFKKYEAIARAIVAIGETRGATNETNKWTTRKRNTKRSANIPEMKPWDPRVAVAIIVPINPTLSAGTIELIKNSLWYLTYLISLPIALKL